jgi:hypothetical protein
MNRVFLFSSLGFGSFVLLVGLLFHKENSMAKVGNASSKPSSLPADQPKGREYVLEIVGVGVTLDKFRQGALWDALSNGDSNTLIRDMDPKKYAWDGGDKMQESNAHGGASVENAILDTPRYWGVPAFNAEPLCINSQNGDTPEFPQGGLAITGDLMHMPVLAHRELSEHPDRIVERIFDFFDQNPTVPYVILASEDSSSLRASYATPRQIMPDGWYVPEMPDTSAVFVLARRDRVDAIRPFVFEDMEEPVADVEVLNKHGIARRIWLNYLNLTNTVPRRPEIEMTRFPTSKDWLTDLELFSEQFDGGESGKLSSRITSVFHLNSKPVLSSHWKPRPWFPVPWNTEQLEQFDALPTFGFLHRPVFVKLTDENGNLLKRAEQRQAALQQGWQSALGTLPETQRAAGPTRVIVATGGNPSQLIDFHGLLRQVAEHGGPKFDPAKANQFIDIDRRIGNTGAATFFMQTAIGVMGSYREGGVSAAFNMRDPKEASIIFISPPSEGKRKGQHHITGGDLLKNGTVPMYDLKNYEEPGAK